MADSKVDIVALFKEAAYEVGGLHLDDLTLDTKLADLSMNSVSVMETIGIFEERLNIKIDDEDLARLSSMRDLEALIEKAQRNKR